MGRSVNGGICFRTINYCPLPSQSDFHRSAAKFKGFSGPVGSGKSQALCQEAVRLAYINSGRVGLIGAPTYPMLHDVTQRAFFDILDANQIPYVFNKAENEVTMKESKSKIIFRPLDLYERLRGTNLAWFGCDELTLAREGAWLRLEARLRDPRASQLCGFAAWTPHGFDWVYKKFIVDRQPDYHIIMARPAENRFLLERVPEYYSHLEKSYDENFYRQEALGQYINLDRDLVYYAFKRQDHVTSLPVDPALQLLWSMDFNVDPMCSIVAQRHGDTLYVVDEIVLRRATTEMAAEEFVRRYPNHPRETIIYGDASGYSHHSVSRETDYNIVRETLRASGLNVGELQTVAKNPHVGMRIRVVNSKLRNARGDIKLWIDPKCKELIKDLEQVNYKAHTPEIDKTRDRERTHASDALGYLAFKEFAHQPLFGEKGKPIL
jgi:hypothetical protein